MLASSSQIQMSDSTVNGPVKTFSKFNPKVDFDYEEAHERAIKFSHFLNTTLATSLNTGISRIKCIDHTSNNDKGYPITNYANASCVGEEFREIKVNVIDENNELPLKIHPDRVVLKGNELVYNVFHFNDESFVSDQTLVIDLPRDSFAIINIDSLKINYLNISNIVFVDERTSVANLIFNFVRANEINYAFRDLNAFSGALLAPYATFLIQGNESEKKLFRGQIFANEIEARYFFQECNLFEAFF
jgi:choice-of-anchor A domain-containing protein